jgi:hypothetical protein
MPARRAREGPRRQAPTPSRSASPRRPRLGARTARARHRHPPSRGRRRSRLWSPRLAVEAATVGMVLAALAAGGPLGLRGRAGLDGQGPKLAKTAGSTRPTARRVATSHHPTRCRKRSTPSPVLASHLLRAPCLKEMVGQTRPPTDRGRSVEAPPPARAEHGPTCASRMSQVGPGRAVHRYILLSAGGLCIDPLRGRALTRKERCSGTLSSCRMSASRQPARSECPCKPMHRHTVASESASSAALEFC